MTSKIYISDCPECKPDEWKDAKTTVSKYQCVKCGKPVTLIKPRRLTVCQK